MSAEIRGEAVLCAPREKKLPSKFALSLVKSSAESLLSPFRSFIPTHLVLSLRGEAKDQILSA